MLCIGCIGAGIGRVNLTFRFSLTGSRKCERGERVDSANIRVILMTGQGEKREHRLGKVKRKSKKMLALTIVGYCRVKALLI